MERAQLKHQRSIAEDCMQRNTGTILQGHVGFGEGTLPLGLLVCKQQTAESWRSNQSPLPAREKNDLLWHSITFLTSRKK